MDLQFNRRIQTKVTNGIDEEDDEDDQIHPSKQRRFIEPNV